jgi:diguanylate cyclase (GGDEF)-like protein/PAS domain S-box-containing protein
MKYNKKLTCKLPVLTNELYKDIFNQLTEGIVVMDKTVRIIDLNEAALKVLGARKENILGKRCKQIFTCDRGQHHCFMRHVLLTGETVRDNEETLLNNQGKPINVLVTASPIRNKQGEIVGGVEIFRDINELTRLNKECRMLSMTDELTKLPNRRWLFKHFLVEMARAERSHKPISLLILDIDDFKKYNDTYGHLAGDKILKQVGASLKKVSRLGDLPVRYGGEEFIILLPETKAAEAKIYAERVRTRIASDTQTVHPGQQSVTVSIGVSSWNGRGLVPDIQPLISSADTALYRAKRHGKNQVSLSLDLPRINQL